MNCQMISRAMIAAGLICAIATTLPMRQVSARTVHVSGWTVASTISPNANIHDAVFINSLTGWAVGDLGALYMTHDGGRTWITQDAGTGDQLNRIVFTNTKVGFIAGLNAILRTTNGGDSWASVGTTTMPHGLLDIAAPTPDTLFVVPSNSSGLWTNVLQLFNWKRSISACERCLTARHVVFPSIHVGYFIENGDLFQTRDIGQHWTKIRSGGIYLMGFLTADHGYIVYHNTDGTSTLAVTTDGGVTWSDSGAISSIPTDNVVSAAFGSFTLGMVASVNAIYATTDGGSTWQRQTLPVAGTPFVGYRGLDPYVIVNGMMLRYEQLSPVQGQRVTTTIPAPNANLFGPTIHFAWQSYAEAAYYLLQIWLLHPMSDAIIDQHATTAVSASVSGTTYALDTKHLPSGIYQWTLVALNTRGKLLSPWIEGQSFTLRT